MGSHYKVTVNRPDKIEEIEGSSFMDLICKLSADKNITHVLAYDISDTYVLIFEDEDGEINGSYIESYSFEEAVNYFNEHYEIDGCKLIEVLKKE